MIHNRLSLIESIDNHYANFDLFYIINIWSWSLNISQKRKLEFWNPSNEKSPTNNVFNIALLIGWEYPRRHNRNCMEFRDSDITGTIRATINWGYAMDGGRYNAKSETFVAVQREKWKSVGQCQNGIMVNDIRKLGANCWRSRPLATDREEWRQIVSRSKFGNASKMDNMRRSIVQLTKNYDLNLTVRYYS